MVEQTRVYDLSQRISSEMPVFPGDEAVSLVPTRWIEKDRYSNHRIRMSVHTGTHLDTPRHFFHRPGTVGDDPLDRFCGPTRVFDCSGESTIDLTSEDKSRIQAGDIVLVRTGMDEKWGTDAYFEDYPVISESLTDFLVQRQISIFGVDSPGPDKYPYPTHVKFFEANICILENLCGLEPLVGEDNVEVFAFPLKLEADSSPVRAVARVTTRDNIADN